MKKRMKNVIKGILIPIAIILSLLIAVGGFYWTKLDKLQFSDGKVESGGTVDDSDDDVLEEERRMADAISGLKEQEAISASGDVNENKDYINILLIGTDERTEYFSDNARGDSCMILTLGKKDGSVKLASLERGMGVPILEGKYEGEYDWLTHTFRYGGADLMMREVRECFKVDVDRYIRVNFATFVQGIENSCNPVFIDVALRLGVEKYYDYFQKFGLLEKTGIDLPGEAGTIMHKKENVGQVELATISFGQSFQITPIQLATTVSALVNGGRRVTPHFGVEVLSAEGKKVKTFRYNAKKHIVSEKTSQTMRELLESVVADGSGKNAYVEGYRIGGKTATSQTLPRSANKYISSFVGFAPADDPQILGMCVIYNPQGVYYGGTIAAPVIGKIFENILPYLGIEKQ